MKFIKYDTGEVLLPINSNAASMTAAPFNMVAIRMSWPGQSTKDTCLLRNHMEFKYKFILFSIREIFLLNKIIIKVDKEKLHSLRWDLWNYYTNHLLGNVMWYFFTQWIQTSERIWKPFTVGPEIGQNILVCHMGSCLPWNFHRICSNQDVDMNHCCIYKSVNKKTRPLISFKTNDDLEN